jgi:hypothetical protein
MSDLKFVFKVADLTRFIDDNSVSDQDVFQLEVDFEAIDGVIKPTIVAKIKGIDASLLGHPDPPGL